eukprot:11358412-Alexandrium_andersonii.AAC.1
MAEGMSKGGARVPRRPSAKPAEVGPGLARAPLALTEDLLEGHQVASQKRAGVERARLPSLPL